MLHTWYMHMICMSCHVHVIMWYACHVMYMWSCDVCMWYAHIKTDMGCTGVVVCLQLADLERNSRMRAVTRQITRCSTRVPINGPSTILCNLSTPENKLNTTRQWWYTHVGTEMSRWCAHLTSKAKNRHSSHPVNRIEDFASVRNKK